MSVFGIDLGTCYSCIAKCDDEGFIEVKSNLNTGDTTTPSVVSFRENEVPIVGKVAKNRMASHSESTIAFVKREMDKEYCGKELKIGTTKRKVSPVEISACILRSVFANANLSVRNTDREAADITQAVITIPAMFNDLQREKTKLAAELAGIQVLALVQEPTAAAISYNIKNKENILVYDLGGGTLDVSIVNRTYNDYNVLGVPAGNQFLGGKDWDEAIVIYVLKKHGIDPSIIARNSREWASLMQEAEERKKELTDIDETVFNFRFAPFGEEILTRSEFESITSGLVNKTIDIIDQAIKNANNPIINRFVLVGGSSRMPMIAQKLEQHYASRYSGGKPTREWLVLSDPDQAIAKGAAKYASILTNPVSTFKITDKASHSYGFKCLDANDHNHEIVLNKILSGDAMCISDRKFTLYTVYDNQSGVGINVIENDKIETSFDYNGEPFLISKKLSLPPNTPKGTAVNYTLNRNRDGIISVKVESMGKDLSFQIAKEIVPEHVKKTIIATIHKMKMAEQ